MAWHSIRPRRFNAVIVLCVLSFAVLGTLGSAAWAEAPCPIPPPYPSPPFIGNLVQNGGFENPGSDALPAGWVTEPSPYHAASVKIERVQAARPSSSGTCSVMLEGQTDGSGTWAVYLSQSNITLAKGEAYSLSYWVKVIADTPDRRVNVAFGSLNDPKGNIHDRWWSAPEWTQFGFSFVAEHDQYMLVFRAGDGDPGKMTVLIDDVSLVPWGSNPWWLASMPATPVESPFQKVFGQEYKHAFDFGGVMTPLMQGYKPVTPSSTYSAATHYGFDDVAGIRLGGVPRDLEPPPAPEPGVVLPPAVTIKNALASDYLYARSATPVAHVFRADVPDGRYKVTMLIGDGEAERNGLATQPIPWFDVYAYDTTKVLTVAPVRHTRLVADASFWVDVTGGEIKLTFKSDPPHNPRLAGSAEKYGWLVNAIVISPEADRVQDDEQFRADLLTLQLPPPPATYQWMRAPTPAPESPITVTAADLARGYIPFTRDYTGLPQVSFMFSSSAVHYGPISPDTVPSENERASLLEVKVTPGEFEPILLGLHGVAQVDRLQWSLTPLGGPTALTAAELNAWVTIRSIRYVPTFWSNTGSSGLRLYRHEPLVLSSQGEIDLSAGRTEALWITVRVPDDTPAGMYWAQLTLGAANNPTTQSTIVIRWEVLRFKLVTPPDIAWGMTYDWDDMLPDPNAPLADMRDHGLNSIALPRENAAEPVATWALWGRLARARTFGLDRLPQWHATEPKDNAFFGFTCPDTITPCDLSGDAANRIAAIVGYVDQMTKQQGTPILFYMADEPTPGFRLEMAKQLYSIVYAAAPDAATFVTIPYGDATTGMQALKAAMKTTTGDQNADVDYKAYAKADAHYNPQVLAEAMAPGATGVWNYTPTHQTTPVTSRLYAGLLPWGRYSTGHFRWTYFDVAALANAYAGPAKYQLDVNVNSSDKGPTSLVYPSLTADEATIGWEMHREGIDDYKYAYTLERKIADARAVGGVLATLANQIEPAFTALRVSAADSGPKAAGYWTADHLHDVRAILIDWIRCLTPGDTCQNLP